jgi:hypothetical protein
MKNKALIVLFLLIAVLLVILIFYKNGFRNEAFSNPPSPYDNGKVYTVGDVIIHDGVIYIMKDGIGAAGYAPPRPTNWAPLPSANLCSPVEYNNGTVYKVGDVVSNDKVIYVMIDGIGAAGYAPPRPTNWTPVSPESIKTLCVAAAPATPGVSLQNPNLVPNTSPGAPAWGQQTVDKNLVPSSVVIGASYTVGTTSPISITVSNKGEYVNNIAYSLGDLVTLGGSTYLNLSWNNDTRGCPAYCASYSQSPTVDTFVWKPVTITAPAAPVTPAVMQAPMPMQMPVPMQMPMQAPMQIPMQAPMQMPMQAPMQMPMKAPMQVSPPVVMQARAPAPAPTRAPAPARAPAPLRVRGAPPGRVIKKEGFSAVSNSVRSDIANSLPFGPADFSSDIDPSDNSSNISFVRNTKYDRTLSNDGDFLNPFTNT